MGAAGAGRGRGGGALLRRRSPGLGLGRVEKLPDHGGQFCDAGGEIANGTRQPGLSVGDGLGRAGEAPLRVLKVCEDHQVGVRGRGGGSVVAGRALGVPSRAAAGSAAKQGSGQSHGTG